MCMETTSQNQIKHSNYQEQFKRLDKALKNQFYLEAIFIEYAIIEDRTESILKYEGNAIKSDNFVSLDRKISKINTIAREKKTLPAKYFDEAFLDSILVWKNERNRMIHALMKQSLTSNDLESLAFIGKSLAKALCTKSTSYKRAVERKNANK